LGVNASIRRRKIFWQNFAAPVAAREKSEAKSCLKFFGQFLAGEIPAEVVRFQSGPVCRRRGPCRSSRSRLGNRFYADLTLKSC